MLSFQSVGDGTQGFEIAKGAPLYTQHRGQSALLCFVFGDRVLPVAQAGLELMIS